MQSTQNAPPRVVTQSRSPLRDLSERHLFGILVLLSLVCDTLFHVRLIFMRRLDLPGVLLQVLRIQIFDFPLPVIQVTINRLSLDDFFLFKYFDIKLYTGFGPYAVARVPVFIVMPIILWYIAKFMKKHAVIRDLFFLSLALLGLFGYKLQHTATTRDILLEVGLGLLFLIGTYIYWALYDQLLAARFFQNLYGHLRPYRFQPAPAPNAGTTKHTSILSPNLTQDLSVVVSGTAIMCAIDSVGWIFLVSVVFAGKVFYDRLHDFIVTQLRLNIGPSFEQNLGSWFSITSLAICTIGLLQRTFGMRMSVGITLMVVGEVLAGIMHFGLRKWDNSRKLDHISTDEFWICFLVAIAALFLIAFGDFPVLHVYDIYNYTSWGRTPQGFFICLLFFCGSLALLSYQFISDLPNTMKFLFVVCLGCVLVQAGSAVTCFPHTSTQQVAPLAEVLQGKVHACVTGTFEVPTNVQQTSALFAPGANYPVWIKFLSSRDEAFPDIKSSMNGLQIKLTGLDPDSFNGQTSHDFVLFSHAAFFTSDPQVVLEYTHLDDTSYAFLQWMFPSWHPKSWRIGPALMLASYHLPILMWPFTNPLKMHYYSTTPFMFPETNGTAQAVKYVVLPCKPSDAEAAKEQAKKDKDHRRLHPNTFFRDNLRRTLSRSDVCLDFFVQKQEQTCTTAGTCALDDPTRPWLSEKILVGKVHIPHQPLLRDVKEQCDRLSLHPWNTVEDHKPYGNVNLQAVNTSAAPVPPKHFSRERGSINAGNVVDFHYQAYIYPTMPKYVKKMLPQFTFNVKHVRQLYSEFTTFGAVSDHVPLKTLDEFWKLLVPAHLRDDSEIHIKKLDNYFLKTWKDDYIFGLQFLAGVSPLSITAHTPEIPLPADLDLVWDTKTIYKLDAELLNPQGLSWNYLKNNGRIFFTDYDILEGIQKINEHVVVYQSMIVFYLDSEDRLMPLAIQLERTKGRDYIYTPLDPPNAWLFARMHAVQSDGLIHETVDHLCFTHLVIESVIIAVNRQLPPNHPIYKLLVPHFLETIAINDLGRDTLLHPTNSSFDIVLAIGMRGAVQLMNKAYVTRFNLSEKSLPKELASRGFGRHGTDKLPGYLYRHDAYEIWDALFEYVDGVVRKHYISDSQVARDLDLQGLRTELADPNLANIKGVPELKTRESLIETLTTIVFLATAQHSAVNVGQADYYGFVPNRPLRIKKPMPENLNLVDEAYIVSALPDTAEATKAIETAKVLSTDPDPLLMMLDMHVAPENKEFFFRLKRRLQRFGEEVVLKRPAPSPLPRYMFFHPNHVAGSISV